MRLILCADDYAQSQGIDDAIIQLIQEKKLSAASCMTLSPHWLKAAKRITPAILILRILAMPLAIPN